MHLRHPLLDTARLALSGALAVAVVGACSGAAPRQDAPTRPAASTLAAPSADDPVDYVVAISVDGLNPEAIRRLGRSGVPSFYRLIDQGATTLNARTEYERTITLPNHTGMVTGRRILGTHGHKVTFNDDNGKTVHASAGFYVRSVFEVVHNYGGRTAFYSAKSKFDFLNRSWDAAHGAADTVGTNYGRDKISRYYVDSEPDNVTRLISRMRSAPDRFSFVHLAYPDRAGHASGFMSATYLDAVKATDRQLGRILDAIRGDARLRAHANVVLTADHGGQGTGHSDATKVYNYTVPFMVWGVGVSPGTDLYALNATTRKQPGTARLPYTGLQPIRNGELANVATDLLDLPVVPSSAFDTHHNLAVR
jgi:hypothetical protein